MERAQSQRLSTDSVHVRKVNKLVVRYIAAIASRNNFCAHFVLHVLVFSQEVNDMRQCIRCGIHGSENQSTGEDQIRKIPASCTLARTSFGQGALPLAIGPLYEQPDSLELSETH